jgi:thermitase
MSTLPGDKYGNLSGTSMATPLVSGLVAFLMAQDPSLTGRQARAILQLTGAKVAIEVACKCRVDAAAAVKAVMEKPLYVAPMAATLKPQETQQLEVFNGSAPYAYKSSNEAALKVDDKGLVTAVADGEATIAVTDATDKSVTSLTFRVSSKTPENPSDCPLGNPLLCLAACLLQPDLPWCP